MKDKNKIYIIISIILVSVVIAGGILYVSKINKVNTDKTNEGYVDSNQNEVRETSAEEDLLIEEEIKPDVKWELLTNKKYGFQYLYPNYDGDYYQLHFNIDKFYSTSTLEEFVEKIWSINNAEADSYKTVSQFKKAVVNNQEVFQFIMNGSFTIDNISGYSLTGADHLFTVFDNGAGVKIVVNFPYWGEDVIVDDSEFSNYKKMLESFRVDKNLIPKRMIPSDWTKVDGVGFSFKYPANIFKSFEPYGSKDYFYIFNLSSDGVYGHITVEVKEEKLDLNNMPNPYSDVEKPQTLKMKEKVAYLFGYGDAGCAVKNVFVELGDRTLSISFSGCDEDNTYPLYQEEELMQSILDTFEFKK